MTLPICGDAPIADFVIDCKRKKGESPGRLGARVTRFKPDES